jgi:hypothetical protein
MENAKPVKAWVATIVAGSLLAGEVAHEAILPHAEIGHQDGNNVPREEALRITVTTTSEAITTGMPPWFLRPL